MKLTIKMQNGVMLKNITNIIKNPGFSNYVHWSKGCFLLNDMFWLEAKILNDMGMFWLINLTMIIYLTMCQITT